MSHARFATLSTYIVCPKVGAVSPFLPPTPKRVFCADLGGILPTPCLNLFHRRFVRTPTFWKLTLQSTYFTHSTVSEILTSLKDSNLLLVSVLSLLPYIMNVKICNSFTKIECRSNLFFPIGLLGYDLFASTCEMSKSHMHILVWWEKGRSLFIIREWICMQMRIYSAASQEHATQYY